MRSIHGKATTGEQIEDVILRHSDRGMPDLRPYLSDRCCHLAAAEILSWEPGYVFLVTGFYVNGFAETDGPVGTVALARAIRKLGYRPVILSDRYCEGYFEFEDLEAVYLDSAGQMKELLEEYQPRGLISIERCGRNREGVYANMRGVDISAYTAPWDELFVACQGSIPTIGVGDGGNEIGMGKVCGPIRRKLSVDPCVISTDILVIASVSNWGAYGIIAALGEMTGETLVPDIQWVENYLKVTINIGSVDGVTQEHVLSVDGKSMRTEAEILGALKRLEQAV